MFRTLGLLFIFPTFLLAQTSWKGTVSTNWSTAGNWTNGVPTSAMNAVLGDSNFTGVNKPRLSSSAVCGSLTVGGAVTTTLTLGDRNLTVSGNVTINANGTISHGKGVFLLKGNWTNNGVYTATRNQTTVNFGGSGAQTLGGSSATQFQRLTVGAASAVQCLQNCSATGGGSSIVINGTIDPGTFQITGGAPITVNSGGNLIVSKSTFNGNFGTTGSKTLNDGSTVSYIANAVQTIDQTLSYSNLTLATGSTKTAGGNLTVRGNLTINPGVTFNAGTFTHNIRANLTNNGTFTPGLGTIAFSGSTNTLISGTTTFNALTVNKSTSANYVTLGSNVTASTVNMTLGSMFTGPNSVTITTTRTGSGIIIGTIVRQHAFTNGTSYAFEGPNNTIAFSGPSGVTSVTLTVSQSPPAGFPSAASINRQYAVQVPAGTYTSATLRLHYLNSELNANAEPTLTLWRLDTAWIEAGKTAFDTLNNWVERSGLTTLAGSWTLAATGAPNVARWNGSAGSAWENASNWTATSGTPSLPPSGADLAEIGSAAFSNQPLIQSAVSVRGVTFGSAQGAQLTIGTGGSLTTAGGISGVWTDTARHAIHAGSQTLTIGSELRLSDGTAGHTINLDLGTGLVAVQQSLIQSGGAAITCAGTGEIQIGGDYEFVQGTFTAGSGAVTYNGSGSQIVAGTIVYHNLVINKSAGTATLDSSAHVTGNVTLSGSGTLDVNSALTADSTITIGAAATLDGSGGTLTVGGNWIRTGVFTGGAGDVIFNGSGAQSIDPTTFGNCTVNKPSGTASLAGALVLNGDLNISGGTLSLGTFTVTDASAGDNLILATGTKLQVGGAANFPATFGTILFGSNSTVEYNGTVAQNIDTTASYANVTLTGASTKTLTGFTSMSGQLLINAGAVLSAGPMTLDVQGNWINNGTFTPSTGSVILDGSASQTIGGSDTSQFFDLTIANAAGITIGLNTGVTDTLTLQSGNITTGSRAIILGPAAGISQTSGYVAGTLVKNFTTGSHPFLFTIGDSLRYSPVSLTSLTVGTPGSLSASVVRGEHPNVVTALVDFYRGVNRYWRLAPGGGFAASSYDALFQFSAADVDSGALPDSFVVMKYSNLQWYATTRGAVTGSSIQILADSTFGDYVAGEPRPTSTMAFNVISGWNMVSVPATVLDYRLKSLFPAGTTTKAYSYSGSYFQHDTLTPGTGYWVKFNGPRPVEVTGVPITAETLNVVTGWNMIGSVFGSIPITSIVSVPPGITTGRFYSYDGTYHLKDTLTPWLGYWVKLTQPGALIISTNPAMASAAGRIRIVPTDELPPPPPEEISSAAGTVTTYSLEQNYPNPFNPSTTFEYSLPEDARVSLRIYNLLGEEVATLVNEVQPAGMKSVRFDAGNLPSGIYFIRLQAGSFTSVKRMLLMK